MDNICLLLDEACFAAAASAKAEGREATDADYRAAMEAAWNGWLNVRVERDMARWGFSRGAIA